MRPMAANAAVAGTLHRQGHEWRWCHVPVCDEVCSVSAQAGPLAAASVARAGVCETCILVENFSVKWPKQRLQQPQAWLATWGPCGSSQQQLSSSRCCSCPLID